MRGTNSFHCSCVVLQRTKTNPFETDHFSLARKARSSISAYSLGRLRPVRLSILESSNNIRLLVKASASSVYFAISANTAGKYRFRLGLESKAFSPNLLAMLTTVIRRGGFSVSNSSTIRGTEATIASLSNFRRAHGLPPPDRPARRSRSFATRLSWIDTEEPCFSHSLVSRCSKGSLFPTSAIAENIALNHSGGIHRRQARMESASMLNPNNP